MNPRVIISTTNDISTDNRVSRVANLLLGLGYDVLWVGRRLPNSLPLSRDYQTHRFDLWFNKGFLFYANYNLRLFFFLLFQKADVYLSNDLDTLLPNTLMARILRKPLVYDSHEYFCGVPEIQNRPLVKSVWTFLEKRLFKKADYHFTVNQSIAELYYQDYGIRPLVVRNIGDIPGDIPVIQKSDLGIPETTRVIINQGSGINVDRGMEEAYAAIKMMDNAVLLLVGSGDVIPKMKAWVKRDQMEGKVIFVDKVPYRELLGYTKMADLGISLDKDSNINYIYSLPNKLFDFIHCGIPVLSSRVVEVKRIVEEYHVGLSLEGYEPQEIAEKAAAILQKGKAHYSSNLKKAQVALTWEAESEVVKKVFGEISSSIAKP